jgi:hypothetical protein
MSLAVTRSRRANAGAQLAQLLNEEEQAIVSKTASTSSANNENQDDFYKTAYGRGRRLCRL